MNTRYFTITDPARESAAVEQAADILRRGGLLAIPTETVYGLGADGLNADAVRHIFEAKGRPQDNPLILHIPDASWLARYCKDVPETAYRLAGRFWPGPLTMILPKADCVPLVTTGGLDTVGMRCPDHAVTRAIIAAAGVPVAAPSANTSGRPSCTTAAHVREDMDGRIDGVVDGGPCRVGVESTIIDLTCTPPRLLRPGGLPLEELRAVLGEVAVDKAVTQQMAAGEKPRAPGMKYRHYAPKAPVTVVTGSPRASARRLLAALGARDGVICFDEFAPLFAGHIVHRLGASGDKLAQSQHVFDALRTFDATDVPAIWAQCPDSAGLGLAVGNRLKKAAGFHTEEADGAFVLGITGGTGAGKTTLLRALEKRGALVLDCDAVYHEMLRLSLIHIWIEEAVEAFDGTLLFVSHDRYFINRFATRVWELEEQRITDYPMGFARYRKVKAEQPAKKAEPEKAVKEKNLTEKPQRGNKNQQAARRQLTICEREIAQQEEALAALDARLEEAASDYEKYSALYAEKEAQEQKLTELMERWEALAAEAGE